MGHILFICIFNGHLGYFYLLAIGKSTPVNIGVQISESLLSTLLAINPEVGFLDHMLVLFLIF